MKLQRYLLALLLVAGMVFPAAAANRPIKDILPEDAIFSIWIRNLPDLLENVGRFIPPAASFLPSAAEIMDDIGFPAEVLASPMAMILMMDDEFNEPEMVMLVTLPNADAFLRQLGGAEGGIYRKDHFHVMPYKGHLAFSDDRDVLEKLEGLEGFYTPTRDAQALFEKGLVCFNLNGGTLLNLIKENMDEVPADAEKILEKMFEIAEQVKAFDMALYFDDQGLMIESVMSTTEDSIFKRYMKPGPAVNLNTPKVALLDNHFFYDSSNIYPILTEFMLKENVLEFLMTMGGEAEGLAADEVKAYVKANTELLEDYVKILGEQTSTTMAITANGLQFIQVQQLRQPERFKTHLEKSFELASNQPGIEFEVTFEVDYTTIDGVNVSKLVYNLKELPMPEEVRKALNGLLGSEEITIDYANVDGHQVATVGEGVMAKQIALMRGKGNVKAINDDQTIRQMVDKIGANHRDITLISPVRSLEAVTRFLALMLDKQPPFALPYSTPIAMGIDFGEESPLKVKLFVPQPVVTELMVAGMTASNIFQEAFMHFMMGGFNLDMHEDWGDDDDDDDWGWD